MENKLTETAVAVEGPTQHWKGTGNLHQHNPHTHTGVQTRSTELKAITSFILCRLWFPLQGEAPSTWPDLGCQDVAWLSPAQLKYTKMGTRQRTHTNFRQCHGT